MAQDNVVKKPTQMATPENTAGNESGETVLIPGTGESAPFAPPANEINISASTEDRGAQYVYPQVKQDVPSAGQGQYQ